MSSEKEFEQDYPGVAKESNVDEIAGNLQQKTDRASILAKLREKKAESNQGDKTAKPEMEFVSLDLTAENTTVEVDTEDNALSTDENDKNDIFPKP